MEYKVKHFNELTTLELYDVLNLRSEVFVVEQDCPYLDVDYKDIDNWHVMGYENGQLVSYCRLLKPNVTFTSACIGRVVVKECYRHLHLGDSLLDFAINYMTKQLGYSKIEISAQARLINFYSKHGFKAEGDIYLEDNIEHIHMIRE